MIKQKRRSTLKKIFISLLVVIAICGVGLAYFAYKIIYQNNVNLAEKESVYIYIPTGSSYNDVKSILYDQDIILNKHTFEWLAERKNYNNLVRSGRYHIISGMGNNDLINLLRSGEQKPVMVTFTNIRTKEQLAGVISRHLETDSLSVLNTLNCNGVMSEYGFTTEQAKLMFLPNTYEFYWNTSAGELLDRMYREYNRFWNEKRREKAAEMNMTPIRAGILASIVQLETSKKDEMAKIAGVYINRLERNMALQADPTVVYATGDFSINRVLNRHLNIDSPYNTYIYRGLPPGPITLPEPYTIDQVLNYEKHNYLYFSAREDFSGYHNFAKTHSQHIANARKYQQALNERRIMK